MLHVCVQVVLLVGILVPLLVVLQINYDKVVDFKLPLDVLTLDIKEDNFLSGTVVVLRPNYVFSPILKTSSVDDKVVIITNVSLHEFHALSKLLVVVIPTDCGCSNTNHPAIEFHALPFVAESARWFYHKSWCCLSSV